MKNPIWQIRPIGKKFGIFRDGKCVATRKDYISAAARALILKYQASNL